MVLKDVAKTIDTVYYRKSEQTKESAMKSLFETEQLKADNQMEWAGQMSSIRNCAEEIVLWGLIYGMDVMEGYTAKLNISEDLPDSPFSPTTENDLGC